MKNGAHLHVSPFAALSFPGLKKVPVGYQAEQDFMDTVLLKS